MSVLAVRNIVEEQRAEARKRSKRPLHKTGDKTLEWNAFKKTWDEETTDRTNNMDQNLIVEQKIFECGPGLQNNVSLE